jgi:hypothetical protein
MTATVAKFALPKVDRTDQTKMEFGMNLGPELTYNKNTLDFLSTS